MTAAEKAIEDVKSLKKCPACAEEIALEAKKCKHCGESLVKKSSLLGLIGKGFLGVFLFLFIVSLFNGGNKGTTTTPKVLTNSKSDLGLIKSMEKEKFLKMDPRLNAAYIDPKVWTGIELTAKENFARSLAIYCGNEKGTHLYWVDIIDKFSGKKLAKYSDSWGFKNY